MSQQPHQQPLPNEFNDSSFTCVLIVNQVHYLISFCLKMAGKCREGGGSWGRAPNDVLYIDGSGCVVHHERDFDRFCCFGVRVCAPREFIVYNPITPPPQDQTDKKKKQKKNSRNIKGIWTGGLLKCPCIGRRKRLTNIINRGSPRRKRNKATRRTHIHKGWIRNEVLRENTHTHARLENRLDYVDGLWLSVVKTTLKKKERKGIPTANGNVRSVKK